MLNLANMWGIISSIAILLIDIMDLTRYCIHPETLLPNEVYKQLIIKPNSIFRKLFPFMDKKYPKEFAMDGCCKGNRFLYTRAIPVVCSFIIFIIATILLLVDWFLYDYISNSVIKYVSLAYVGGHCIYPIFFRIWVEFKRHKYSK